MSLCQYTEVVTKLFMHVLKIFYSL